MSVSSNIDPIKILFDKFNGLEKGSCDQNIQVGVEKDILSIFASPNFNPEIHGDEGENFDEWNVVIFNIPFTTIPAIQYFIIGEAERTWAAIDRGLIIIKDITINGFKYQTLNVIDSPITFNWVAIENKS